MSNPTSWPYFQVTNEDGRPISGAKIYTYKPGTTTDKATYKDYTRSTANENPITTDDRGEALIYLRGATKFLITDDIGTIIRTVDWVGDGSGDVFYVSDYDSLAAAVTAIGSDEATLYLPRPPSPATNWPIDDDLTIGSNIALHFEPGSVIDVADAKTLTIDGPIEAGPYQIFSWNTTGAIDLTGSPTDEIPLEWFGAVSGVANDSTDAFAKVVESTDNHQWMIINKGVWRLTTAQVIDRYSSSTQWASVKIKGRGMWFSQLYIDVGAGNVGVTIGQITNQETQYCELEDFSFVGPATCCSMGLQINEVHHTRFKDVAFWLGSSSYALNINGCLFAEGNILVNAGLNDYSLYTKAHDGILVTGSTTPYQSNVVNLRVNVEAGANNGVYFDGTNYGGAVVKLTGTIEGYGGNPLQLYKQGWVDLTNLYIEGTGNGITLNDVDYINMDTVLCNSDTDYIRLTKCRSGFLTSFYAPYLYIDQDCQCIELGEGALHKVNGLVDNAPDTVHSGTIRYNYARVPTAFMNPGHDARNLIDNYYLDRWNTTDGIMDGWSLSGAGYLAFSKAGVGESDTTRHLTDYCAKMVLTSGDDAAVFPIPTRHLTSNHGKWMNYTINLLIKSAQTFTTYPSLEMDFTVPTRANSTAYQIGDEVIASPDTGYHYTCVATTGNTAGSQPTMSTTPGDRTVDGGVTWVCNYPGQLSTAMPCTAADIGVWKPIRVEAYCPRNCTAGNISLLLYRQTGGTAATFYMETPALMIGRHNPRGLVSGENEHKEYIKIGDKKIWSATPAAGTWIAMYDIDLSTLKYCSTAGKQGTTASWTSI